MSQMQKGSRVLVGYTSLGPVIEEMDHTNATAKILDDDVRNYVKDENYKKAWGVWFAEWTEFYQKRKERQASWRVLLGPLASNPDLANSDAIAEQARKYRQDLARWQATYAAMRDAQNKPLPSNAPKVEIPPLPGVPGAPGIPLGTFLLIAGAIGVAVFIYWRLKKTSDSLSRKQAVLEETVLPAALFPYFGPKAGEAAKLATTRDMPALAEAAPSVSGDCGCARDLELTLKPRAASKYFLSGR